MESVRAKEYQRASGKDGEEVRMLSNIITSIQPSIFWSAFLAILSAVLIDRTVKFIDQFVKKRQLKKDLKFEVGYNRKKIERWLSDLDDYRNKVNGDSLTSFFTYFDLSKVLTITLSKIIETGLLYKLFTHEEIGGLQNFLTDFSVGTEKYMNDQIKWNRDNIISDVGIKPLAGQDIDFWKSKFQMHEVFLQKIESRL